MKKIGIIGIGNPLRNDDGIGILLLEQLRKQKKILPLGVEYIDGGTSGMNLLHQLARFQTVFIIDAVDFNAQPGETRLFALDEIKSKKIQVRLSTHETDFLNVLHLSEKLNELPKKLFIFAVQPKDVSQGTTLSKELQSLFNSVTKKLIQEIQSHTQL